MIPKNIRGLCKNLWISRWNSFLCSVLMSSDPSPQQATRAREQSYPHQGALVLITIFCHQDSIHPAPLFLFLLFYLLFYYYYFLSLFSFSPCSPLYCRCSNNENKTNICLWPNKWTFVPNICLSNIWLCAPEYMALCPFNIWPCAPQYMSKQYMALCPPIYALCPSFCNVVKRYVLSNLDATSHWISAYLKRISTCRLTVEVSSHWINTLKSFVWMRSYYQQKLIFVQLFFVILGTRTAPNPHLLLVNTLSGRIFFGI